MSKPKRKPLTRWKIIDWANNDVNTGGETFDSFEDGWGWIYEHVSDDIDGAYDDLFVVAIEQGDES